MTSTLKPICFILDVDGVMTTGHFLYSAEGKHEEAADQLLAILEKNANWKEGAAKEQLRQDRSSHALSSSPSLPTARALRWGPNSLPDDENQDLAGRGWLLC